VQDFVNFKSFLRKKERKKGRKNRLKKGPDVNEGKINNYYKTAYNFSVSLIILIPFFIILNFLNKKESKVICKREFEIILLQTQRQTLTKFIDKAI
jgi:hypothetical protein